MRFLYLKAIFILQNTWYQVFFPKKHAGYQFFLRVDYKYANFIEHFVIEGLQLLNPLFLFKVCMEKYTKFQKEKITASIQYMQDLVWYVALVLSVL